MSYQPTRRPRPLYSSKIPEAVKEPKIKWKVLPILWMAFKRMCFFLGFVMFISALIGVYSASFLVKKASTPAKLPDQIVLYLPLDGELPETPREATFAEPFTGGQPTIHEVVYAIKRAAKDARVQGLVARLDNAALTLTNVQEIREALAEFKMAGKFTKIYSSSYGGSSNGLGRYYLASAFDEIWMQPLGIVTINGVQAEVPFLRGLLDKIGVVPNFFQRKEYKTAYESLTNKEMSPQNKRSLEQLINGIKKEIVRDVPADRGMDEAEFLKLVDHGLFTAKEALDTKLITHMEYADTMVDGLKEAYLGDKDSEDPLFVGVSQYSNDLYRRNSQKHLMGEFMRKRPRVALIYVVGAIMDSDVNAMSPVFMGGGIAASDKIAGAIMEAADDETIETVVLRVDSPGGSPIASERILRALHNAKQEGKHVIVSMGATAASGGYWVTTNADRIFAMPTTITGSIGVLGGKFAMGGVFDHFDVSWNRDVRWGENAGMWSVTTPFSASEAERVNAMLDQIYDAFLERVASGRGMSVEDVDKIAGGRIWTGEEAVAVGLVDEIGGMDSALQYAAELAGVADRDEMDVIVLPKPKSPFEQIIGLLSQQGVMYQGYKVQSNLINEFQPYLQDLMVLGGAQGPLVYEPTRID